MAKTDVLIIGPTPPPYNGMSVATGLVLSAIRPQMSVAYLDTADRRGLSNVGRLDPVNILLASYHGLRYLWLLAARRPQIVYVPVAQDWLPFLRDCLFLIPARLFRRKLVVHLHGGSFASFYQTCSPTMRWIIRLALGTADRAIVLGKNVGRAFDGVISENRICVIPNGIPDYFRDAIKPQTNHRPPTVLFLSTLMREKGVLDVFRALPEIAKQVPNVRAVFAGEWYREEDRDAASKLIAENGLGPFVEFAGPVVAQSKFGVLQSADLLVLPSFNEGQPYVILEAMAAGLPIISTNIGCIPETVVHGVTGFIVEPGHPETLAEKVVLLLGNGQLRSQMAKASRKRYLQLYTFEKFTERINQVFQELSC